MLEDAKVEELAEHQGFEAVPPEGVAIANDPPALEDPPRQGYGRRVEDDQVYFIGPQVPGGCPDRFQASLNGVHRLLKIHGHIHVTERREPSGPCPAEQVCEDSTRTLLQCRAECAQPCLNVCGKEGLVDHGAPSLHVAERHTGSPDYADAPDLAGNRRDQYVRTCQSASTPFLADAQAELKRTSRMGGMR
jgi:hypothetical protein